MERAEVSDRVRRLGTFVVTECLIRAKQETSGGEWIEHNVIQRESQQGIVMAEIAV